MEDSVSVIIAKIDGDKLRELIGKEKRCASLCFENESPFRMKMNYIDRDK